MLNVNLICVGRMRETHYIAAFSEYEKRLKPYCKFELTELPEVKLPQNPSQAEIEAGLHCWRSDSALRGCRPDAVHVAVA